MSKINNGGPAFSALTNDTRSHWSGMSLRDYFASQALIGMGLWSPDGIPMNHEARAHWAYAQADAMLKAREVSDA